MIVREALVADPRVLQAGAPAARWQPCWRSRTSSRCSSPTATGSWAPSPRRRSWPRSPRVATSRADRRRPGRSRTCRRSARTRRSTRRSSSWPRPASSGSPWSRTAACSAFLPREPVVRRLAEDEPPQPDEDTSSRCRRPGGAGPRLARAARRPRARLRAGGRARSPRAPLEAEVAERLDDDEGAGDDHRRAVGVHSAARRSAATGSAPAARPLPRSSRPQAVTMDELGILLVEAERERPASSPVPATPIAVRRPRIGRKRCPDVLPAGLELVRRPAGPSGETARSGGRSRGRGSGASRPGRARSSLRRRRPHRARQAARGRQHAAEGQRASSSPLSSRVSKP